jgi:hypothetical protein
MKDGGIVSLGYGKAGLFQLVRISDEHMLGRDRGVIIIMSHFHLFELFHNKKCATFSGLYIFKFLFIYLFVHCLFETGSHYIPDWPQTLSPPKSPK